VVVVYEQRMSKRQRTVRINVEGIRPLRPGLSQSVLIHLLSFLPLKEVARGQCVCRAWRVISTFDVPVIDLQEWARAPPLAQMTRRFSSRTTQFTGSLIPLDTLTWPGLLPSLTRVDIESSWLLDLSVEEECGLRDLLNCPPLKDIRIVMPFRRQPLTTRLLCSGPSGIDFSKYCAWFTDSTANSQLEHLRLEGWWLTYEWSATAFLRFFGSLPRTLLELRLGRVYVARPILLALLERCPRLTRLQLDLGDASADDSTVPMKPDDWQVLSDRVWTTLVLTTDRPALYSLKSHDTLWQFARLHITDELRIVFNINGDPFDGWKDPAIWKQFGRESDRVSTIRRFEWGYPAADDVPNKAVNGPVTLENDWIQALFDTFPQLTDCRSLCHGRCDQLSPALRARVEGVICEC
jgi:hypothetical protein